MLLNIAMEHNEIHLVALILVGSMLVKTWCHPVDLIQHLHCDTAVGCGDPPSLVLNDANFHCDGNCWIKMNRWEEEERSNLAAQNVFDVVEEGEIDLLAALAVVAVVATW